MFAALAAGLLLAACNGAAGSVSPSAESSASAEPTPTAVATDSPDPTPSPTEELLEPSAYGARGTVAVDGLRVRGFASMAGDVLTRLDAGTEVRPMSGPVMADGFRWFWVSYGSDIDLRYPGGEAGWAADTAISESGEPEGEAFIEIGAPTCPGTVDTELLANLSEYAVDVCDVQVDSITGLIDQCIEGPNDPWDYEPQWVWFSCLYLRDEEPRLLDSEWFYNIAFPPGVEQPEPGDLVTLHGQIGFDEGEYGECAVKKTIRSPVSPVYLDLQNQLWDIQCQLKFVVSEVEVTDHIDLPPPIGN